MNFSVAMLKQMRAEGLDFDAAIRVLEAGQDVPVTAADKRKAYDRERKRRQREELSAKSGGKSAGNPVDGFPNDIDILTPSVPHVISDEITPPADLPEKITEDQVLEAYNAMADLAGLPKARMTPERRKKIKTFVRRHAIDDITEAIWAVPKSRFLCGENDRGWKADLDFLLQPKSFTRVLEGTYAH